MAWYDDPMQLRDFAEALVAATDIPDSADILAKPYKYTNEFLAWKAADYPAEDDSNWDNFVESLTDEVDDDDGEDNE